MNFRQLRRQLRRQSAGLTPSLRALGRCASVEQGRTAITSRSERSARGGLKVPPWATALRPDRQARPNVRGSAVRTHVHLCHVARVALTSLVFSAMELERGTDHDDRTIRLATNGSNSDLRVGPCYSHRTMMGPTIGRAQDSPGPIIPCRRDPGTGGA